MEIAQSTDLKKHELLEKAQRLNAEADKLTHKKIVTVQDVLSDKLSALTEESKVGLTFSTLKIVFRAFSRTATVDGAYESYINLRPSLPEPKFDLNRFLEPVRLSYIEHVFLMSAA